MPAPATTRRLGTAASSRAPVEETIFFSSTATPGSGITSEPEAIRMLFAASVSLTTPSSRPHGGSWGRWIQPAAWNDVILFLPCF